VNTEIAKAILFDLDDTIAAWDSVAESSWLITCGEFAARLPGIETTSLYKTILDIRKWYTSDLERHRYMRLNLEAYRREMVGMAFSRLGVNDSKLASELAATYGIERERAAQILPGALAVLEKFRRKNIGMALITNGSSKVQRAKITRHDLFRYFDLIVIEEEFGCGKPDERVFRHALEKLDANAAEVWMVGDDLERDIGGAKNTGIYGVWVDWRQEGLPGSSSVRPDRIVNSISELT
jgi:putative hydrolase of the HAD superfamily